MTMTHSVVLIVPAAIVADGNRLAWAMGWQEAPGSGAGETFGVPLSASGKAPATHYGTHTWAGAEFLKVLGDAKAAKLPDKTWTDYNLSAKRTGAAVAAIVPRIVEGIGAEIAQANWQAALAEAGLKVIEEESK